MSYKKLFFLIVGVIAAIYLIPIILECILFLILYLTGHLD